MRDPGVVGDGGANRNLWAAVACGALLALGTLMSYIFLVFGCFILLYTLLLIKDGHERSTRRILLHGVVALVIFVWGYCMFWLFTEFDPVAAFRSISARHDRGVQELARPFPQHIPYDLLDFALGSGWISFLLLIFLIQDWGKRLFGASPKQRAVLISLVQILVVALAALLPGEAARLWMPMLPLLMVPVGVSLAEWSKRDRMAVYTCLWIILVVICQNMTFLYLKPEWDGPRW